jgi:hypothetical protein
MEHSIGCAEIMRRNKFANIDQIVRGLARAANNGHQS